MQDLGGRQNHHAENDLEESQRFSRQGAPACCCPLEHDLNGTSTKKLELALWQFAVLTALYRITTLELFYYDDDTDDEDDHPCRIREKDAERFTGVLVLVQCPALV